MNLIPIPIWLLGLIITLATPTAIFILIVVVWAVMDLIYCIKKQFTSKKK